jgi:hypothetical protein
MARFYGEVGYGLTVEKRPGVHEVVITERKLYGEVVRNARTLAPGENLNENITLSNTLSLMADAFANEHFFAIQYVKWMGVLWSVSEVEVKAPRLIVRLGGVYNGESPRAPEAPGSTPG